MDSSIKKRKRSKTRKGRPEKIVDNDSESESNFSVAMHLLSTEPCSVSSQKPTYKDNIEDTANDHVTDAFRYSQTQATNISLNEVSRLKNPKYLKLSRELIEDCTFASPLMQDLRTDNEKAIYSSTTKLEDGKEKYKRKHPKYHDYSLISLENFDDSQECQKTSLDPHRADELKKPSPSKAVRGRKTFPVSLHKILEMTTTMPTINRDQTYNRVKKAEQEDLQKGGHENDLTLQQQREVIHWLPHGRAFVVTDKELFVKNILSAYFPNQTEYASFQRQMNIYGFLRLVKQGPAHHTIYYHELFLRGRSDLCTRIPRLPVKLNLIRQSIDPQSEPDLNSYPPVKLSFEQNSSVYMPRSQDEGSATPGVGPLSSIHGSHQSSSQSSHESDISSLHFTTPPPSSEKVETIVLIDGNLHKPKKNQQQYYPLYISQTQNNEEIHVSESTSRLTMPSLQLGALVSQLDRYPKRLKIQNVAQFASPLTPQHNSIRNSNSKEFTNLIPLLDRPEKRQSQNNVASRRLEGQSSPSDDGASVFSLGMARYLSDVDFDSD
jgi:HSF-type DNA-binding